MPAVIIMGGSRNASSIPCVSKRQAPQDEQIKPASSSSELHLQLDEDGPVLNLHQEQLLSSNDQDSVADSYYSVSGAEEDAETSKHHKKSVSFSSLEVRNYKVIIGDHPCCTMGCALSLGWEYSEAPKQSLEKYEAERQPRKSRQELRTTWEERRKLLTEEGGYSEGEVRRAQRKMHRVRSCSAKLSERMNEAFFASHNAAEVPNR